MEQSGKNMEIYDNRITALHFQKAYSHSGRVENVSLCIMYCCQLFFKCFILINMHVQITKGFGIMNTCIIRFGIRIGDRKYLNEYTPFGSVSL